MDANAVRPAVFHLVTKMAAGAHRGERPRGRRRARGRGTPGARETVSPSSDHSATGHWGLAYSRNFPLNLFRLLLTVGN